MEKNKDNRLKKISFENEKHERLNAKGNDNKRKKQDKIAIEDMFYCYFRLLFSI